MARVRNYQTEYANRIANGIKRAVSNGFAVPTKAELRGHKEVKKFTPTTADVLAYIDRRAEDKQQHKLPKSFGLSEATIRDLRKAKLSDAQIQDIINKKGGGVQGRIAVKGMNRNIKKKAHFAAPDEEDYGPGTIAAAWAEYEPPE